MKHFKLEVLLQYKIVVDSKLHIQLAIVCCVCVYNAHLIFLPFVTQCISNNPAFPF